MPKISIKCQECSKVRFRGKHIIKPKCYKPKRCCKKRNYYRNIEHYRKWQIKRHRYIKYRKDRCAICHISDSLVVHHIDPQFKQGVDNPTNLLTLCTTCHKIITKYYGLINLNRKSYINCV